MRNPSNASNTLDLATISTYEAGVIQSQAHRKLKKEVSDYLRPHGLTMMEWFALGLLKDAASNGMRPSNLTEYLGTSLPYTTNLLNSLTRKGLITRSSEKADSRTRIATILPGAVTKVSAIETDLREKMRELIYGDISPDELRVYIKVLYQIAGKK